MLVELSLLLSLTIVHAAPAAAPGTVYTHASVPGYELSSANPEALGLDTVKQQAGYLGTPSGDQLFYWFFESRSNPADDPVVIWLNGGPGCSSLEAILFENGPASISTSNQITHNPWSWNADANVLYIDNPANVGFSKGHAVSDSIAAAEDFKNAVRLFFEQHSEFTKNKFVIAGESYAGRYVPVFTEAINSYADSPVKVESIMIGNGLVNPVAEYASYEPMLCGEGGRPAVLSNSECEQLRSETPGCTSAMTRCMDSLNDFDCEIAQIQCNPIQNSFAGKNPYDIRDATCAPSKLGMCYPGLDNVQNYFNDATVQRDLGVEPSSGSTTNYQVCNTRVDGEFYGTNDPFAPTFKNVTTLLEQGTSVLVYNGDADIILNWLGGRMWTRELAWSGQSAFDAASQNPVDWVPAGGQKRGEITNYGKLTFLRVADAGHMVPHDQPESASYMVRSWIQGDLAFKKKFT